MFKPWIYKNTVLCAMLNLCVFFYNNYFVLCSKLTVTLQIFTVLILKITFLLNIIYFCVIGLTWLILYRYVQNLGFILKVVYQSCECSCTIYEWMELMFQPCCVFYSPPRFIHFLCTLIKSTSPIMTRFKVYKAVSYTISRMRIRKFKNMLHKYSFDH